MQDVGEATPHRSGRNDTIDSDAGDTPVMRPTTTKRVLRIVESDEDMTDPENVSMHLLLIINGGINQPD